MAEKKASEQTWTVSSLVAAIRMTIEAVPAWQDLVVAGELSGVKRHSSGHWYFTLKDDQAQLRAVMFRRDAMRVRFVPQDGMAVLVRGRIGVFERDGQTQIYVHAMQEIGAGAAYLALEQLKQRLYAEGLFSRPKRRLPRLPRAVGVVTSPSGAARHDVETVIERRFAGMRVVLYPVLVQGGRAAASIVDALERVSAEAVDVVIVGRGGGSREDLNVFNDEAVVRAMVKVPVPVISAVGHEIDTTLSDLVADVRAATPSAAAELAVPEKERLRDDIANLGRRARQALSRRLQFERERIAGWVSHGILTQPLTLVERRRVQLDRLDERVERRLERMLATERGRLDRVSVQLSGLNPRRVLERGYTYVSDDNGRPMGYSDVQGGQSYLIHWYNGKRWMLAVEEASDDGKHDGGQ